MAISHPHRAWGARSYPVGTGWGARLLVVAALGYDAYVHASFAPERWGSGRLLTEGQLFAAEAVAAAAVALALVASGRRAVWVAAAVVALGGAAAVVLMRYVDVGAFGPVPDMYEPVWYGRKTASAVVESLGGLLALSRWWQLRPARQHGGAG